MLWMVLVVLKEYLGFLRTAEGFLKNSCAPDVLEEPEGILIESPTGIAYGISGDIHLACLLVLMLWS